MFLSQKMGRPRKSSANPSSREAKSKSSQHSSSCCLFRWQLHLRARLSIFMLHCSSDWGASTLCTSEKLRCWSLLQCYSHLKEEGWLSWLFQDFAHTSFPGRGHDCETLNIWKAVVMISRLCTSDGCGHDFKSLHISGLSSICSFLFNALHICRGRVLISRGCSVENCSLYVLPCFEHLRGSADDAPGDTHTSASAMGMGSPGTLHRTAWGSKVDLSQELLQWLWALLQYFAQFEGCGHYWKQFMDVVIHCFNTLHNNNNSCLSLLHVVQYCAVHLVGCGNDFNSLNIWCCFAHSRN